ncbi:polysaccharide deacetylase family protein [Bradyrhizobium prioriisuperbiae]|uniref:polysaccharide deacetylase family protein n=1 Tax=Bradyrhizobium prioriisuperbiae TaxID=2854389 RepID=UPI0028E863B2|nr:polysaccharide deacetylase family protein [Bradyrhizobium prioritasuperba]
MPWGEGAPGGLALQLAYFSGVARLLETRRGGFGVILRLQRVRPASHDRFQPLKAHEITPEWLERLVRALRRWKFDVVSIEEAVRRMAEPAGRRRFVCLTFDGAYRDVVMHAYPVLARHQVPFTVYVPTGFVDGIAPMWWLALQQVIASHDRISLVMDRNERHFDVAEIVDKHDLYGFLANWMRRLASDELTHAIHDLCSRYAVDLAAISRTAAMDWADLSRLAADARVTIGTATVNYPALAAMTDAVALREMTMGRQVAEAALGRPLQHFAYPFGDPDSAGPREAMLAAEAGFASAVSAQAGVVWGGGRSHVLALPRISWDGRRPSLRALRVRLSGL